MRRANTIIYMEYLGMVKMERKITRATVALIVAVKEAEEGPWEAG